MPDPIGSVLGMTDVGSDTPSSSIETVGDIQAGDHIESSSNLTINRRGSTDAILQKDITGSLLSPSVSVRTKDPTP